MAPNIVNGNFILEHQMFNQINKGLFLFIGAGVHMGFTIVMLTTHISDANRMLVATFAMCSRMLDGAPMKYIPVCIYEKMITNVTPSFNSNMVTTDAINRN